MEAYILKLGHFNPHIVMYLYTLFLFFYYFYYCLLLPQYMRVKKMYETWYHLKLHEENYSALFSFLTEEMG